MAGERRRRVVIVGGGPGGDAAAFGLRKAGFAGEVVLISMEPTAPYDRPLLSKQFLRSEAPKDRLFLRPEAAYKEAEIELIVNTRVEELRLLEKRVTFGNRSLSFDVLVVATGSTPRRLPGIPDLPNIQTLRNLSDAEALVALLKETDRILIVGAGFIGAEVASSCRQLGKQVLMVEAGAVPLERALGRKVGEVYADIHRSHGVDLRTSTTVTDWFVSNDRLTAVGLSDGSRVEVQVALLGTGVTPNLDLLRDLPLTFREGGVSVDDCLLVAPDVYAIGDIAAHFHPIYQRSLRVEHWQVAQKQGSAVGRSIAERPTRYEELPWFWSDQYDINLQYVGHAAAFDQAILRGDTSSLRFSVFYLTNGIVDAVLSVNDARTGRLGRELIRQRALVSAGVLSDTSLDPRESVRRDVTP